MGGYTCKASHRFTLLCNVHDVRYFRTKGVYTHLDSRVEWPRPFRSVPHVGSLKRPKLWYIMGTPLMTRGRLVLDYYNKSSASVSLGCVHWVEYTYMLYIYF